MQSDQLSTTIKDTLWPIIKSVGPKLMPFFKSLAIFFVLYPTSSPANIFYLIIKCTPIAALCLFVILHGINLGFEYSYSRRILTGLIFSMIGDAFLVYPKEYFEFGMVSFAIAHVIYFTAFGLKPFKFKIAIIFFFLTLPLNLAYFHVINDNLLKVMVPVYILLIASMIWRAMSRLRIYIDFQWTKLCCLLGAILFAISDFCLAYNKFVHTIPYSHVIIMSTYYAGQLGIALSIVNSNQYHEVNYRVIQQDDLFNVITKAHSSISQFLQNSDQNILKTLKNSSSSSVIKIVPANLIENSKDIETKVHWE